MPVTQVDIELVAALPAPAARRFGWMCQLAGTGAVYLNLLAPAGGVPVWTVVNTGGGSGITASQHEVLRQLVHLADGTGGPWNGFASGAVCDTLPYGTTRRGGARTWAGRRQDDDEAARKRRAPRSEA